MQSDRNHNIASAAGVLELLEILSSYPAGLPLTRLAALLGRPKSSVHRALATLVGSGFVEQDAETLQYRLTIKLWRIGMAAIADRDIITLATPRLRSLMVEADETVHLSMLDPSGGIVYVAKVECPRSVRVQTQIGKLNPSWSTATGRAILAFRPDVADKVLSAPLKPVTPDTVVDPQSIRKALAEIARNGFAVTKGENHPEIGGVAAPIRQHDGDVVAACGIAAPVFRLDRKLVERSIPLVVRTAEEISASLGFESDAAD